MLTENIINDKILKAKAKVQALGNAILDGSLATKELISYATKASETNKATCIEALELATKQQPAIADKKLFDFAVQSLTQDAPRVKWESAKLLSNIVHLHPTKLDNVITNLLANTNHDGTVVRWATATALAEVVKLKTKHNTALVPAIETLLNTETDNGVKKKYLDALKKVKK